MDQGLELSFYITSKYDCVIQFREATKKNFFRVLTTMRGGGDLNRLVKTSYFEGKIFSVRSFHKFDTKKLYVTAKLGRVGDFI